MSPAQFPATPFVPFFFYQARSLIPLVALQGRGGGSGCDREKPSPCSPTQWRSKRSVQPGRLGCLPKTQLPEPEPERDSGAGPWTPHLRHLLLSLEVRQMALEPVWTQRVCWGWEQARLFLTSRAAPCVRACVRVARVRRE